MHNLSFLLFFEFFKVGLFTFGGGYAALPFLYSMIDNYSWFTSEQLTQMIAISGITPGPIGLNMATFAGFQTIGIKGAIISSFALVVPMFIVTSFVFRLYKKFSESKCVKNVLYFLRPTSCALIASVGIKLFYNLVLVDKTLQHINYQALLVVGILYLMTFRCKRNPAIYIFVAGVIGVIVKNLF